MKKKYNDYILKNKLKLRMVHDVDKELLDKAPYILENERHMMSDMLAEYIYQRLNRYETVFKHLKEDDPEDVYEVERHVANLYVFSQKELEGLLKL